MRPCPKCNESKYLDVSHEYVGVSVTCENCYDVDYCGENGAPKAFGPRVWAETESEARRLWDANVESGFWE